MFLDKRHDVSQIRKERGGTPASEKNFNIRLSCARKRVECVLVFDGRTGTFEVNQLKAVLTILPS